MRKKGKWSKEEDYLIRNHIEKHGIGRSWQELSNTLGLQRCGRSCRSRWLNYLRPGLKHGNFTPAEDKIICEMYSKRGSCWSVIAAQLPGRTDLAVKNYWNSTLKKRVPGGENGCRPPQAPLQSDRQLVVRRLTPARDLQLIVCSEESSTAGSSCAKPVLPSSPMSVKEVQPLARVDAGQDPIEAVPVRVSAPVRREEKPAVENLPLITPTAPPPPPAGRDQTGEMDTELIYMPMSPIPLSFMDPELACICGFDDIHSFLPWFDRH